ncbi:hypothetical protein CHY_2146 [Carboxydothermus hydrogenoformans Z-2901]|uniref:Uncharacterized protein n=1 Tax=Carboxydothermus hydrogenoformans (strain ATCC BAA-161 / DSM 6008 / Z-2901) TaxID=246194 RepID=Q3AA74_CARHZ|nr:hypothetical protein CHY_2146 [Carboxydothermus hydrogenoformans Z-2901]
MAEENDLLWNVLIKAFKKEVARRQCCLRVVFIFGKNFSDLSL